ncbi:rhomboid family intramembrane serine protease [Allonocardiopsis opalescens]|uniref:Membrane associated rhomboid family serine protease n=1 Tax=Allonocardiopsis opalescens TaxID=1144618 RepID=A0A2T0PT93_9ACTN|nr:rhomboid family intramembrane serine protease [Allonocardiopsis opalescens]PRX92120.1 membrane associated rhomboid family serine protease [Allonocardiopsis opalescens]
MKGSRLSAVYAVLAITAVVWLLEIVDFLGGGWLDGYGIVPRHLGSLSHIFSAPFLHFGFDHLISNTLPLVVLGLLVAMSGLGRFLGATAIIILTGGLGVWLFSGDHTLVAGSSILVFGYFGFLVVRGFVERRTLDIVAMICVVIFYGTLILGVLPVDPRISWIGHLFGLIGGVIAALKLPRRTERPTPAPDPYNPSW